MKCGNCGKPVQSRNPCGDCLVKIVEKRARKAMRNKRILPDSGVLLVNDGSCEGEVNLHLAGKLLDPKNIKVKAEPENGSDFICVPDTADKIAGDFLDSMLSSNVFAGDEKKTTGVIRLLGDSISEEVHAYAKEKGIEFREGKEKSAINSMTDRLEQKHKGTKFALAKSAEILK